MYMNLIYQTIVKQLDYYQCVRYNVRIEGRMSDDYYYHYKF